jgi:hypothetical protein
MQDQMTHLAATVGRPNITVQPIPRAEAHVGLTGAFDMAETADAFVAHLEHVAHGLMTDSPAIVVQATTRFDALKADAYRGSESVTLIEEMARKWSAPWRKSSYSGPNGGSCVETADLRGNPPGSRHDRPRKRGTGHLSQLVALLHACSQVARDTNDPVRHPEMMRLPTWPSDPVNTKADPRTSQSTSISGLMDVRPAPLWFQAQAAHTLLKSPRRGRRG